MCRVLRMYKLRFIRLRQIGRKKRVAAHYGCLEKTKMCVCVCMITNNIEWARWLVQCQSSRSLTRSRHVFRGNEPARIAFFGLAVQEKVCTIAPPPASLECRTRNALRLHNKSHRWSLCGETANNFCAHELPTSLANATKQPNVWPTCCWICAASPQIRLTRLDRVALIISVHFSSFAGIGAIETGSSEPSFLTWASDAPLTPSHQVDSHTKQRSERLYAENECEEKKTENSTTEPVEEFPVVVTLYHVSYCLCSNNVDRSHLRSIIIISFGFVWIEVIAPNLRCLISIIMCRIARIGFADRLYKLCAFVRRPIEGPIFFTKEQFK